MAISGFPGVCRNDFTHFPVWGHWRRMSQRAGVLNCLVLPVPISAKTSDNVDTFWGNFRWKRNGCLIIKNYQAFLHPKIDHAICNLEVTQKFGRPLILSNSEEHQISSEVACPPGNSRRCLRRIFDMVMSWMWFESRVTWFDVLMLSLPRSAIFVSKDN